MHKLYFSWTKDKVASESRVIFKAMSYNVPHGFDDTQQVSWDATCGCRT